MPSLDAWAWWSKEAGSGRDYAIIECSADGAERAAIAAELRELSLGNPRSEGLPWAAFAAADRPRPQVRVCWWDWTDRRDAGGRPVLAVLYLRLDTDGRVGLESLAEYARSVWELLDRDRSAPMPEPKVTGPGLEDLSGTPEVLRWASSVAALTLCRPVRVKAPAGVGPVQIARRLDGVAALLPAPTRATLVACTGTARDSNGPFQIAVGRPTDQDAVLVESAVAPDLRNYPAAQAYRERLEELLELYPLAAVLDHLAATTSMPEQLGDRAAQAATVRLAGLDRLVAVAETLRQGRDADTGEVRDLATAHQLADRLAPELHRAFLVHLLRHGTADDLALVARHWLPGLEQELVTAFRDRHRDGGLDDQWVAALVDPVERAGPDEVLPLLLDQLRACRPVALLVGLVVTARLPAERTRDWLLEPVHQHACGDLVKHGGREVPRWLAGAAEPPGWATLLAAVAEGVRHDGPEITDPYWLRVATRLASDRHQAGTALDCLLPDLVAAAVRNPRDDAADRWLEKLPLADPSGRATADLLLLLHGRIRPPGLRRPSAFARHPGYARRLADLAAEFPEAAPPFRADLVTLLCGEQATEDALVLLELMHTHGGDDPVVTLQNIADVARARPGLLFRPGTDGIRDRLIAADPDLRREAALRAARSAALTAGPASELAAPMAEACRAGCEPAALRSALDTWPGLHDPDQVYGLTRRVGEQLAPGGDTQVLCSGLGAVLPLLTGGPRDELAGRAATWKDQRVGELDREIDSLYERIRELLAEREQACAIDELLALDDRDPRGRTRWWTRGRGTRTGQFLPSPEARS
ncbi:hypothetical protein [Actinoplanes sp. NPDC051851]|uniref:hypothetical protein n=1 Tax=Actinoplanes sp. NPDC051851 TaxID=3154753 RepID=UPI0034208384